MKLRELVVLGLLCVVCSLGRAATIDLGASLNGAQEVPPVVTPAFGLASVSFDDVANTVDIKLLVEGISLAQLADNPGRFHIHGPAGIGQNASVILNLGTAGQFQQFGQLIGFFADDIPLPDPATNAPLLLSGQTYLNLHTQANPSGEIRGQILIPEPAGWLLLLSALVVGATGLRRVRR